MLATSRYRFATVERDQADRIFLGPRTVFGFRELTDTIVHVVSEGDTLHQLAARYYRAFARPEQFFWVIADFQPEPIRDITIAIEAERRIFVPSLRTLQEQILSPKRDAFEADDDS